MKKILQLPCCLSLFILAINSQANAAHGGCRVNANGVSYSAKKLDDYHPTTYNVIASGIIEYYHKGHSLPTEKEDYSKKEDIPASSESKAKKLAADKTTVHAEKELQKQCEEKKCRQSDEQ